MNDEAGVKHRLLVVPENVNQAAVIAYVRIFIGVFWLFEVTVGHNWKVGGFGSGANPGWIGPGAGDAVRESIGRAVDDGTWAPVAWLFESLIEPNAAAFSYLVVVLQVMFGLFFIFGFMVRPTALLAIAFDLSVFFLGNSRIPPFFTAAHLLLAYAGAGMYYGADGWIVEKLNRSRAGAARAVTWLIALPFLRRGRVQSTILVGTALAAVYFFLQIVVMPTARFGMVALDLAVIFALVAAAMYFARTTSDHLGVVAGLLRIFIGLKFLHEIWVRTEPGVNGLPGWAGVGEQRELFETIANQHWTPIGWVVETAVLPAMAFWVVLFGALQFVVGVMLVLGYRTRVAAIVGLGYLGALAVLGFTRYAPFVFGLLVVVLALDAGRRLGLDSARLAGHPVRYGLPVRRSMVPALVVLAVVGFAVTAVAVVVTGGIAPDGYTESMPQMVSAMVALFAGMFALVGWLQLSTGGPDDPPRDPVAATKAASIR